MRTCNVPGCEAKNYARGGGFARLCKRHYTQIDRHGRLTPERDRGRPPGPCAAPKCEQTAAICPRGATARYCLKHARQVRTHGRLTPEREHVMNHVGCRVPGCAEEHRAGGFCVRHYNQARWQRIKRLIARAQEAGLKA